MNAKLWKFTLPLSGLAIALIVYFSVSSGQLANEKNVVAIAKTTASVERFISGEVSNYDVEQKNSFVEGFVPSAEASIIEDTEYSAVDDKILGAVFNAEYAPVVDDSGNFLGFRISSLSDEVLTDIPPESKLQNGDVITQINNVLLDSEENLAFAIAQLFEYQENAVITFDVERGGDVRSISFGYQP